MFGIYGSPAQEVQQEEEQVVATGMCDVKGTDYDDDDEKDLNNKWPFEDDDDVARR